MTYNPLDSNPTPQNFFDAADLIEKQGLSQYSYARNSQGKRVNVFASDASKFCFFGALCRIAPECYNNIVQINEKIVDLGFTDPIFFNDIPDQTSEDVASFLREIGEVWK